MKLQPATGRKPFRFCNFHLTEGVEVVQPLDGAAFPLWRRLLLALRGLKLVSFSFERAGRRPLRFSLRPFRWIPWVGNVVSNNVIICGNEIEGDDDPSA